MLKKIDDRILAGCTRVAHALQRATGLTNYFITKCGAALFALKVCVNVVTYWSPIEGYRENLFGLYLAAICFLGIARLLRWCDRNKERLYRGQVLESNGFTGPLFARLMSALLVVMTPLFPFVPPWRPMMDTLLAGECVGLFLMCYFSAVCPLPPGTSKIRQWVDACAGMFRRPVRVGSEG